MDDLIMIVGLEWQWIAAIAGLYFGGAIMGAAAMWALGMRPTRQSRDVYERDTEPCDPPADALPVLWADDEEHSGPLSVRSPRPVRAP